MNRYIIYLFSLTMILSLGFCVLPTMALAAGEDIVIGTSLARFYGTGKEKNSTNSETSLGNAVADAIRDLSGANLAIIPGGIISSELLAGDVTTQDFERILPDNDTVVVTEITAEELKEILEFGVSHIQFDNKQSIDYPASVFEYYPQISGFTFQYDISAPVGERVMYVWDAVGNQVDINDLTIKFKIASTAELMSTCEIPYQNKQYTTIDAMIAWTEKGMLTKEEINRVKIVGDSANTLLKDFPIGLAGFILILLLVAFGGIYRPKMSYENGFEMPKE